MEVRGTEPGPLFLGVTGGGAVDPQLGRLGPDAILAILRRRARRAGVADFSAHDLRRTFIGEALEAGADRLALGVAEGGPVELHGARATRGGDARRAR